MPRDRLVIIPNCQTSAEAIRTLASASMTVSASCSNMLTSVRR